MTTKNVKVDKIPFAGIIALIGLVIQSVKNIRKMREDGKIDAKEMQKIVEIFINITITILKTLCDAKILDEKEVREVRVKVAQTLVTASEMAIAEMGNRVNDALVKTKIEDIPEIG